MNIRDRFLATRGARRPSPANAKPRTQRKFATESLQELEGRQLLASFSISYSATVPEQTTDYTAPTSLPKFDPSLGTLTAVELSVTANGTEDGTLTNTASGPETFSFEESVNVALSDGTSNLLAPTLDAKQSYATVAPGATVAFGPFSPTATNATTYTAGSQFNEFGSGPGNVALTVTTLTQTVTSGGGGNVTSQLTTTAGETATVTYLYQANPVNLAGNVYEDALGTGSLAPGDPPIPGTALELLNSSGVQIATTVTGADGSYSFTSTSTGGPLPAGTYTIHEIQPPNYLQGTNTVGTVDGATDGALTGVDNIGSIVLAPGENSVGNNFGEVLPVTLSGNVYEDQAGLGVIAPGDPPISGTTLELFNAFGTELATTTTAANGSYQFTSANGSPLAPGIYTIDEVQPAGYLQGSNTVGTVNGNTDGALTGVDQIGSIALLSGQSSINNNFGEILPVSISGTVYDDVLKAGLLLPGDLPIPGTTVTLFNSSGVVATTTTNAYGVYSFTTNSTGFLLRPGTYTLVETQPAGFQQGTNTIGTVNGVTDGTMPVQDIFTGIVLKSGQSSTNNNFGEVQNPPPPPAPTVTTVDRFGVHNQPTLIYLTFSTPLDPTTAQNVANYQIFGPTDSKDPAPVPIRSATYNAATNSVTLNLGERLQVHHPYTLTVTGLTNTAGVPLVDSNGRVGSPYVTTLDRSTLAGFTDIYGDFIPIDHGKLYPAASASGYELKRFVPPAKLGSFAPANTAAYHVATGSAGEIAPLLNKGLKPIPAADGSKGATKPPKGPIPLTLTAVKATTHLTKK